MRRRMGRWTASWPCIRRRCLFFAKQVKESCLPPPSSTQNRPCGSTRMHAIIFQTYRPRYRYASTPTSRRSYRYGLRNGVLISEPCESFTFDPLALSRKQIVGNQLSKVLNCLPQQHRQGVLSLCLLFTRPTRSVGTRSKPYFRLRKKKRWLFLTDTGSFVF